MKNVQVKLFFNIEELNEWLKTFQGEIFDIKFQSENRRELSGKDLLELLVIYQN